MTMVTQIHIHSYCT